MPGAPCKRPVREVVEALGGVVHAATIMGIPSAVLRSACATGLVDAMLWRRIQEARASQVSPHWEEEPWEITDTMGAVPCPLHGTVLLDVCYRNYTAAAALELETPFGCGACDLGAQRRAARAAEGHEVLDTIHLIKEAVDLLN